MRILSLLTFGFLFLAVTRPAASAPAAYKISGVALHQCSCVCPCPCMFENAPDDCALAAIYHLDKGTYNGVDVSGLSFISIDGAVDAHKKTGGACCAKGKTTKTNAPAGVVYVDAKATPAQKNALVALCRARGEWPGEGRPVKSVPIQFTQTARGYRTVVPGLFQGETEGVLSRKGTPLIVDGVGFVEGPRWIVGRSRVNDLHDKGLGLDWHMPGTNGCWTFLDWSGTD